MSFSIQRTESPRRLLRPAGAVASSSSSTSTPSSRMLESTATDSPARSIYSKEYLDQLKAGTASTPPPSSRRGEYDELTRSKFGASFEGELSLCLSIPASQLLPDS